MYSQGLIGSDQTTEETPEFLAAFQARIDAEQKIEPNDPGALDFVGWSLDAHQGRLVAGAYGKFTGAGNLAGAAYVFERRPGGFVQVNKLAPPELERFDNFGLRLQRRRR